jgi:hypothetical protein
MNWSIVTRAHVPRQVSDPLSGAGAAEFAAAAALLDAVRARARPASVPRGLQAFRVFTAFKFRKFTACSVITRTSRSEAHEEVRVLTRRPPGVRLLRGGAAATAARPRAGAPGVRREDFSGTRSHKKIPVPKQVISCGWLHDI